MRKTVLSLIAIIFLSVNALFAQSFTTKVGTIFEDSKYATMEHVKSAIDSKGNLYVVFLDATNGIPYFGTNKSGVWKFETLEYFDDNYNDTTKVSSFPNIAIDKKDNVSIVMFGRYRDDLIYATKSVSDARWKFSSTNETSHLQKFRVYGKYTDMCTDKNGGLHVISQADYQDKADRNHNQSAVYFYKSPSGKWQSQMMIPGVIDEFAYGEDPSIASYGDKVYVTLGGSNHLHFAEKNISGGQWNIEELFFYDNSEINTQKFETSLCLSPEGSPYFAFYEYFAEGNYKYHGLNMMSKSVCKDGEWTIDQSIPDNVHKRRPAIGIDNNNKTYVAFAGNRLHLYAKSCECSQKWELLYNNNNIGASFIDMVIDKQNIVHVFYSYEKKLYHLKTTPTVSAENCNYRPSIAFSGKTNVAPGEKWAGIITTNDPECDPVEIYSIILPYNIKLTDHGDGTASIKGTIEEGEGFGDITFVILCNDDKHPGANAKQSKVSITLELTQEGIEKGSVKYDNNCNGKKSTVVKPSGISTQGQSTFQNTGETVSTPIDADSESMLNAKQSKTCKEYLDRYEAWADKYIPLKKKVNTNPMDIDAVMKLANMAPEIGNWGLEWSQKQECSQDPAFIARFEKISGKIDEVNE